MPEVCDFARKRDVRSESWSRADPNAALIERLNIYGWRVWLPGGSPHEVVLAERDGDYTGRCDCDGFRFNDGPCAHLCTLRKADYIGAVTTREQRVQIADYEDGDRRQAQADRVDGRSVATDGGRHV